MIRARNGIVDPRTGKVEAYKPDNATTVRLDWDYVENASCPKIDQFFREALHDDATEFIYELAGYMLLPRNRLRKAVLLHGPTGAGKSVALTLLTGLAGKQYVASVPLQRLGGDDRFAPARLTGKLANICGDISPIAARDMSLFKQITGGDRIFAEHKGRDGFEFECGALPIFSGNEFPRTPDTTYAYLNRWVIVGFPSSFSEDLNMEAKLKALARDRDEMTGFLSRSVQAAGRLLARGDFELPESSRKLWENYKRAVDPFSAFIAEECVFGEGQSVNRKTAFLRYESFCKEVSARPLGRTRFYEKMRNVRGVSEHRDREFRGVDLRYGMLGGDEERLDLAELAKAVGA